MTDEQLTLVINRAMASVIADDLLVDGAIRRGRRRVARRRRTRTMSVALLAAGSVTALAIVMQGPSDVRESSPAEHVPASPSARPIPLDLKLPSERDLTEHLAEALPGPSTRVETRLTGISVGATRGFGGGTVSVTVTLQEADPGRLQQMCDRLPLDSRTGSGCTTLDAGWLVTSSGQNGADASTRFVDVTYYSHTGEQVSLHASASPPSGRRPMPSLVLLTAEQLADLAMSGDWYDATS